MFILYLTNKQLIHQHKEVNHFVFFTNNNVHYTLANATSEMDWKFDSFHPLWHLNIEVLTCPPPMSKLEMFMKIVDIRQT